MENRRLRSLLAVSLGNGLEMYDFTVFALFAIQIGKAFFPSQDPRTSLLAAFATFGAGFLTRPLGAFVLGRLGDRRGRGPAMVLSMALMGLAVTMLALCPGYARIGLAAPLVALTARLLQGFALGGEVGPTTAYLLECAPLHRRAVYVAVQRGTQLVANICGAVIGVVLASLLSPEAFATIAWRIAVGIGAVVAPFALYMRRNVPEPPAEPAALPCAGSALAPAAGAAGLWRTAVACCLVGAGGTISAYVLSYMVTFGQADLHLPARVALAAQTAGCAAGLVAVFGGAMMSDRWGRRRLILLANLLAAALVPLVFLALLQAPRPAEFILATAAVGALLNFGTGAVITVSTESFPRHVRSMATALAYTVPVTVFGGTTQFAVAWLIGATGSAMVPALYAAAALLLSSLALLFLRETAPVRLGLLSNRNEVPLGAHV
jgi:MFS family permease